MKTTAPLDGWLGRVARVLAACALAFGVALPQAQAVESPAARMLATYARLQPQLADNAFARPLHLDSEQLPGALRGNIHAVVDHPFATVGTQVRDARQWCEILLLHLNVKHCVPAAEPNGVTLTAYLGKKTEQPLEKTHRVAFGYRVAADASDYLQVELDAPRGPFGTRDYRIVLEAVPLESGRTFVHLSYAYAYGPTAALAMRTYLTTVGLAKVGFTAIERRSDGKPVLVGDLRGALERNTMRYFLALDAYLGACSIPPQAQLERRLHDWFAATERYALQLRELEQDEYLDMKRREYRRLLAQP